MAKQAFLIEDTFSTINKTFTLLIVDDDITAQYIKEQNSSLLNQKHFSSPAELATTIDTILKGYPYYSTSVPVLDSVVKTSISNLPKEMVETFNKTFISQWGRLDSAGTYTSENKSNVTSELRLVFGTDSSFILKPPFTSLSFNYSSTNQFLRVDIPFCVINENSLEDGIFHINSNTVLITYTLSIFLRDYAGTPIYYQANFESNAPYYYTISQTDAKNWLDGVKPTPLPTTPTDPFNPGGTNKPGGGSGLEPGTGGGLSGEGGGGSFDVQNVPIPLPGLPSLSATGSGFVGLFNPTTSQLNALAAFMWSDNFFDQVVKLFGDPMDVILGLNIVPVKPATSGSAEVKAGFVSTGVSMPVVSSQYVTVDCGNVAVKEFWGSALDYSPYTQCQIYLPYIGTHQLDIDEIMGKTLHLIYNVDILSGSCVACLQAGESTLYTFNGSCASAVPVTGQSFNTIISTAVQLAAGVGSFVASGGSMIGAAASGAENALTAAATGGMKPTVQHSGSVQATNGLLANQTPYLIFSIPTQSVPENQNQYEGYPSNMTLLLGNCSGYTKVRQIHLVNLTATETEVNEIESLLKEGVQI